MINKVHYFVSVISVIFFCVFNNHAFSAQQDRTNIHCVDTFDMLAREVETLGKDDLVIFDVDGVLLLEDDAIFGVKAENKAVWQKLFGTRFHSLPQERVKYLYSIVRQQSICKLVDGTVIQIIKNLYARNVKAIALTAIKTGKYGVIECVEDWRFNQLKELGIDFSSFFPLSEPRVLFPQVIGSEDSVNQTNSVALAKKGIVFAGEYNKGDVLRSFLQMVDWRPQRIIFVDDNKHCLDSIAAVCEELGIEFMGLHYVGAEKISKPIDEVVACFQVDYFFDHQEWLSDQQAQVLMQRYAEIASGTVC